MMDIAIRAMRSTRLLRSILIIVCFGFVVAPSRALAAGDLSSVVISKTFLGMVASMPGPANGPITKSNLSTVVGSNDYRASEFMGQQLASGDVIGYVRVWRHQPTNGDRITISAFRFKNVAELNFWQDGVNSEIRSLSGVVTFAVPGVKGATGYTLQPSESDALTLEFEVTFVRSNTAFLVNVFSPSGKLTSSDAAALARNQEMNTPDDSSITSGGSKLVTYAVYSAALIIGVVALVLSLLQIRRRHQN